MLDELVFAIEHQLREPALAVGLDGRHVQIRRVVAVGVAGDEGAVDGRGVLEALLVDVQVAEARVQEPGVGPLAVALHVALERAHAVVVGEHDAHDPEGVLDQLAVAAPQALELDRLVRVGTELAVKHAAEARQALQGHALLEQGPAVLVERLLVEARCAALADHGRVGLLCLGVALAGEQQLAAAELHLVDVRALRVAGYDAVQSGERLVGLPGGLVGARQLVEHLVVARIVGIGLQQRRVQADGLGPLHVDRGDLLLQALELAGIEVQVAQAPHGLGAQLRVGVLQLEEAPVVLHRLGGVGIGRGVPVHLDLPLRELADRLRCGLCVRRRGGERRQRERERRDCRAAHCGFSGAGSSPGSSSAPFCTGAAGLRGLASSALDAARSYMLPSAKRAWIW